LRTGDKSNVIETRLKKEAENLRGEKDILNEDIDVSIIRDDLADFSYYYVKKKVRKLQDAVTTCQV
jgi:hypothetical protein